MKEFSDRTVSVFLILALVSVAGGFFTILYSAGRDLSAMTGFATTGSAQVNVTVDATSAITITPAIIEFGSGTLTSGTAGTAINTSGGGSNVGGFSKPSPINVTNDGNTDLNITINGTLPSVWLSSGSTYEWAGANTTEAGSCGGTGGFSNLTTARTPFSASLTRVCANLTFSDGTDSISIHIFLNLTSSLAPTTYTDTRVLVHADRCTGPC